jgi:hypothetical protein
METTTETPQQAKQRHGCLTAFLVLMIIANSAVALIYLFAGDTVSKNVPGGISSTMLILLAVGGILNVIFSVMLLRWKKIGFWGFIITSLGAFIINLSIGLGVVQSILGLAGVAILYGVLQIKKDNISAWSNLD